MARGNLYAFVFPTTGARHYVSARNEQSAFRKFCKMLGIDEGFARKFRCECVLRA